MQKKITMREIMVAEPVLARLMQVKCKFTTSLAISKLIKNIEVEAKALAEEKLRLFKLYGVEKEDGGILIEDPQNQKKFYDELEEVLKTEIKASFEPIPHSLMESIDITPSEILMLSPFLSDSESNPE